MSTPSSSSIASQLDVVAENGTSNGLRHGEETPAKPPADGALNGHALESKPNGVPRPPLPPVQQRSPRNADSRRVFSETLGRKQGGDDGREKKRQRLSGGFLLQPLGSLRKNKKKQAVRTAPDQENERQSSQTAQDMELPNGDQPEEESEIPVLPTVERELRHGRSDGSAGELYNDSPRSSQSKGKDRMAPSPNARMQQGTPESSNSAQRRSMSRDHTREVRDRRSTTPAEIDPSQIVRMALSLNEGRRLGLLPGQLPPSGPAVQRRAVSAAIPSSGSLIGSQSQRPASSMMPVTFTRSTTPNHTLSSNDRSRTASSSPPPSRINERSPLEFEPQNNFTVSAATVLRAEKARTFFELSHDYRRLLEVLPPLKPIIDTSDEKSLNRPYNPLQYIRNHRVRTHERHKLDSEKAGWNNVNAVSSWVDAAETEAQLPDFRSGDIALLPSWHPPKGHRTSIPITTRASIASAAENQARRNRSEWMLDPADLLADAYWLEANGHKSLIEDRHGHKLFKRFQRPREVRRSPESSKSYTSPTLEDKWSPTSADESRQQRSPISPRFDETETDDGQHLGLEALVQSPTKTSFVKRRLLRRKKNVSDGGSSPSGDEDANSTSQNQHTSAGQHARLNIGPLERHMKRMMEDEDTRHSIDSAQPNTLDNSRGQRRRGGVSEDTHTSFDQGQPSRKRTDSYGTMSPMSPRSSFSSSATGTPRISVEDYDNRLRQINGDGSSPYSPASPIEVNKRRRSRHFALGFLQRRGKSKQQNGIAENDFATTSEVDLKRGAFDFRHSSESDRSSLAANSRNSSHKSLVDLAKDSRRKSTDSNTSVEHDVTPKSPVATRFFKGGRIGELVRTEASGKSDVVWKRQPPHYGSTDMGNPKDESEEGNLLLSARQHRRSQSTNDLRAGNYHISSLPAFRSVNEKSEADRERRPSSTEADHISVQQQAILDQKARRKARFDRLAPLSTPADSDVSPNTSPVDLSRLTTQTDDQSRSKASTRSNSPSPSSRVRVADNRLNRILELAGGVGRGGLPPTGLSSINPQQRRVSRGHRDWNIADDEKASSGYVNSARPLTARDIYYVRCLLLSSGVKAQSILRRANTPPERPSDFLVRAYASAGAGRPLRIVSRREEHVSAARLLSTHLERTTTSFESAADSFRNGTCDSLHARIMDLRDVVGARLTPDVRAACDEADAFTARLTTTHTLAIKQVTDNVEALMRRRWSRLRLAQKVGWASLEWMLVGFMWAIWLVVLCFRAVLAVVRGLIAAVRWLLWI